MSDLEQRARECRERITDYLSSGGLFNSELALHERVRDLLIECRRALAGMAQVQAEAPYPASIRFDEAKWWRPRVDLRHDDDCCINFPDSNPASDFCDCDAPKRLKEAEERITFLEQAAHPSAGGK